MGTGTRLWFQHMRRYRRLRPRYFAKRICARTCFPDTEASSGGASEEFHKHLLLEMLFGTSSYSWPAPPTGSLKCSFLVKTTSAQQTPKEKIHFGWMAALVLGGAILGYVAFFISPLFASDDTQSLSIWQSILTNFVTGLVSAGLLLLVEPKIRRAVKTSVTNATVDATAGIKEDLRDEVQGDIEQTFASLEQRINLAVNGKLSDQDKKLADLSKDFTRTAVLAALKSAVDMNSLHQQEIFVQATGKSGELRIGLRLALPAELQATPSSAVKSTPWTTRFPTWSPTQATPLVSILK
ncbi:hypothetical protein SAMN02799638_01924 [Arthrobacter sp. UNCCL28]|nr:hypothetical protein SAMN02799638_01924 [Arthrobacter sp. UNCCL28]